MLWCSRTRFQPEQCSANKNADQQNDQQPRKHRIKSLLKQNPSFHPHLYPTRLERESKGRCSTRSITIYVKKFLSLLETRSEGRACSRRVAPMAYGYHKIYRKVPSNRNYFLLQDSSVGKLKIKNKQSFEKIFSRLSRNKHLFKEGVQHLLLDFHSNGVRSKQIVCGSSLGP